MPLQNADDNRYAAGALPALEFLLLPEAVAALNNESGLTAADVRALCDVGASTKLAKAYIGYKGIGFKSVFKVRSTESQKPQRETIIVRE
jgi:hypothetical protein